MQFSTPGRADWRIIAEVVRAVDIPVLGNGDVRTGADARRMLEETGCAHVMVGRAAQGNPWVFAEIRAALEAKAVDAAHFAGAHAHRPAPPGHGVSGSTANKRACWKCASTWPGTSPVVPGAARLRERVNALSDAEEAVRRAARIRPRRGVTLEKARESRAFRVI